MRHLFDTHPDMNNYKMVDIMKFICAIMVISIHAPAIIPNPFMNYVLNQIVCRIAVPFFLVSGAYFVRKRSREKEAYCATYFKSTLKSYLFWSLVFIPFGIHWINQNISLAPNLLPFALLFGLIHIGTFYHLWYIPASLFSLFLIRKLTDRFSYKTVFVVSFLLFLFGSIETYFGLIPDSLFKTLFHQLIDVIYTTRSGLFYAMIFTTSGFFIYDFKEHIKPYAKYAPRLTLCFALLLLLEGALLYNTDRLDANFLIMLVPFTFTLFISLISSRKVVKLETQTIRNLSKYYYFIHPFSIVIVTAVAKYYQVDILASGIVAFVCVVLLTHLLTRGFMALQKKPSLLLRPIFAVVAGVFLARIYYFIQESTFRVALISKTLYAVMFLMYNYITYKIINANKNIT